MESFLAGRPAIPKSAAPGSAVAPSSASAPTTDPSAAASAVLAAGTAPAMNMDAFESLFAAPTNAPGTAAAASQPDAAMGSSHTHAGAASPSVEIVRGEDGAVRRVIVTCTCGERIQLDCDY